MSLLVNYRSVVSSQPPSLLCCTLSHAFMQMIYNFLLFFQKKFNFNFVVFYRDLYLFLQLKSLYVRTFLYIFYLIIIRNNIIFFLLFCLSICLVNACNHCTMSNKQIKSVAASAATATLITGKV